MITTYTAAFSPTMRWPCPLLWVGASSVALAVGGLSPVGPSRLPPSPAGRSVSGQASSLMLSPLWGCGASPSGRRQGGLGFGSVSCLSLGRVCGLGWVVRASGRWSSWFYRPVGLGESVRSGS